MGNKRGTREKVSELLGTVPVAASSTFSAGGNLVLSPLEFSGLTTRAMTALWQSVKSSNKSDDLGVSHAAERGKNRRS